MRFASTALLSIGLIFCVANPVLAQRSIELSIGQVHTLDEAVGVDSIDFEDASLVKVTRGSKRSQLFLQGAKNGSTKMRVSLANGEVVEYLVAVSSKLEALLTKLRAIGGVKIEQKGGRVFVSGSPKTRQGRLRLSQIVKGNPATVVDLSNRLDVSGNTVVRTVNRILRESDIANIQAHAYGKIIVLEGSAKDEAQAALAMRIARLIYPSIENRIDAVTKGGPSISIEVLFVEVNKSNEREIGIKHGTGDQVPNGFETGLARTQLSGRTGTRNLGHHSLNWQVGGLASFLQLIENRTSSRVLSNPKLIARTGEAAKFHAGKTTYLTQQTVADGETLKEFEGVDSGIELEITPVIDALGQIDAKVKTSVSEFDLKDANLPEKTNSEVQTSVTIQDGQTIMLSGLVHKRNLKSVERVPLLADIPLVGELFKSRKTIDEETEMLVLVTMNRVQAQDDRIKASGHRLWEQAEKDIRFSFRD